MLIIKDSRGRELPYSQNTFPDGQTQFKMLSKDVERARKIYASISNSAELDLFLQSVITIKPYYNLEGVYINYFYGGRSDKSLAGDYAVANVAKYFELLIQGISDVRVRIERNDTIEMISASYPFVSVLAPHCQFYKDSAINSDFSIDRWKQFNTEIVKGYDMVIFPDESAQRRFSYITENFLVCEKHRDQESGDIISHKIPELGSDVERVIVLDDLCDGGRSFVAIADTLPKNVKADLFVFHGVLSNNALSRLLVKFNKIITTNSLPYPTQQNALLSEEDQSRVTILNVW